MTELQCMQLDMLDTFFQICSRLGLHPYLILGSALGAAKYQGFIPWDDDVDAALVRPEYERFVREAPALLPQTLFLQTARSDPAFPQLYAKLRRNATSYVEDRAAHLPMHHGVYIDLFPLDGLPQGKAAARRLLLRVRVGKAKLVAAYSAGGSRKEQLLRRLGRLLGFHRRSALIIGRLEQRIARFDPSQCELWCCHGNWRVRYDIAPASQYGSGRDAWFEHLRVRVPSRVDDYLTQRYGDWRADPPSAFKRGRAARIDLRSDRLWRMR